MALYNYFLINGGLDQADKSTSDGSPEVIDDSESESGAGASSSVAIKNKEKMKHNVNFKFATLQNLNQDNSSDEEEGGHCSYTFFGSLFKLKWTLFSR